MNRKVNFILFIVFAFVQLTSYSETSMLDTIVSIDDIIIQSTKENFNSSENNNYKIDSTFTKYYTRNSIADLLQYFTPIQINQNGPSGIASISVRGTADDQTNIFWNGVKLNSLSLGSADISMIPINIAKNIEVITNATSTTFGSGNFGAAVLLKTTPQFKPALNFSLQQTFASFKNYKTDFAFSKSTSKIVFSSSSSFQKAENNFKYYDKYKINTPLLIQQNNQLQQWVTVNDLAIKLKKQQTISLGNYSTGKQYYIPAIMGSYENSKKYQEDFGTKSFFNYDKTFRKGKLSVRENHSYDYLYYTDKAVDLVSTFKTHQVHQAIDYQHQFNSSIFIDVGSDYNFNSAKIKAYKENKRQHRFAFFVATKFLVKQFVFNLSLRQESINTKYIRPQVAASISYKNKKSFYHTTLSYADKFRYPDLNDLFWIPGGNPNLQPEYGYSTEWQQDFTLNRKKHQFQYSNALYFIRIKDNIVWTPMASGMSTPFNIKKTQHIGIENTLRYTYLFNQDFALKFSTNYNFNHSAIVEDKSNAKNKGKFLRYKPQHTLKTYVLSSYKYLDFGINYLYVGKRFTEDDNVEVYALKPYHILDLFVALKYNHKTISTALVFKANNLLNTSYESVRSYAQPLRNYQFSIIFNFNQNNHE